MGFSAVLMASPKNYLSLFFFVIIAWIVLVFCFFLWGTHYFPKRSVIAVLGWKDLYQNRMGDTVLGPAQHQAQLRCPRVLASPLCQGLSNVGVYQTRPLPARSAKNSEAQARGKTGSGLCGLTKVPRGE